MSTQQRDTWLVDSLPPAQALVGVVGAGVMGAGIAQVAAQAGHPVRLMDVRPGAAAAAREQIAKALAGLVAKGRMEAAQAEAVLARIEPVEALQELAGAELVVEVIVEKLEPKQQLLRELDALLGEGALIASNTSSISITALANGMSRPQRLVGMHFFNPVPLMKLVEVISGAETDPAAAEAIRALATRWGKTAVLARSTPGFIVNRIARPYYAETLALLQEQAATPAALDAALRSAGFRMGPCELTDLIGQDTNYLVTQSVFEANFGDKRFVPSLVQKALVDGGRLGRKVGKGFYEGAPPALAPLLAPQQVLPDLVLHGRGALVDLLARWCEAKALPVLREPASDWQGASLDGLELHLCEGRSAAELAHARQHQELAVLDWPLEPASLQHLAVVFAPSCSEGSRALAGALLARLGCCGLEMRDVPGLVVARTIAMLVNEGADAVWQGVCEAEAADLAMKLGVNYPAGPFEWLARLGARQVCTVLDGLFEAYRSERYRISPLLRHQRWSA